MSKKINPAIRSFQQALAAAETDHLTEQWEVKMKAVDERFPRGACDDGARQEAIVDVYTGDMTPRAWSELGRSIKLVNLWLMLAKISFGVETVEDASTKSRTLAFYGKIVRQEYITEAEEALCDRYYAPTLTLEDAVRLFADYEGVDYDTLYREFQYTHPLEFKGFDTRGLPPILED